MTEQPASGSSPTDQIRAWIARSQARERARRYRAGLEEIERQLEPCQAELEKLRARLLAAEESHVAAAEEDVVRMEWLDRETDRLIEHFLWFDRQLENQEQER